MIQSLEKIQQFVHLHATSIGIASIGSLTAGLGVAVVVAQIACPIFISIGLLFATIASGYFAYRSFQFENSQFFWGKIALELEKTRSVLDQNLKEIKDSYVLLKTASEDQTIDSKIKMKFKAVLRKTEEELKALEEHLQQIKGQFSDLYFSAKAQAALKKQANHVLIAQIKNRVQELNKGLEELKEPIVQLKISLQGCFQVALNYLMGAQASSEIKDLKEKVGNLMQSLKALKKILIEVYEPLKMKEEIRGLKEEIRVIGNHTKAQENTLKQKLLQSQKRYKAIRRRYLLFEKCRGALQIGSKV